MNENPTEASEAYSRGVDAGVINARLANHDAHFATINGSLDRITEELRSIHLGVQRLGDQAIAREATVAAAADALQRADEIRHNASDQRWTPVARVCAVLGALVGLAGVVVAIVTSLAA